MRRTLLLLAVLLFLGAKQRIARGVDIWFLDADRDGIGGLQPIYHVPGTLINSAWTRTTGDCNDANPLVFQGLDDLYIDCDLDGEADDLEPQTVCVGAKVPKAYACAEGTCVATVYVDAGSEFWRPASDLRKDAAGSLILDASPGCNLR